MKILLFKLGAIGDVLMTTPLIRQLRKQYPNAKIDFLIGKISSQVLINNDYLDDVIKFDESIFEKKEIFSYYRLVKQIRKRKYDIVYVLDKHWIFNLTVKLFTIPERIGFNRGKEGIFLTNKVDYGSVRHEINYYLDLAKTSGINVNYIDNRLDLFPREKDENKVNELMKKYNLTNYYVLVNSGGNKLSLTEQLREIPTNIFADLIRKVTNKNKVVFLAVKGEKYYYDSFVLNENCINLAGETNIQETYLIMKKAKKIVVPDCGQMHMASAANNNIVSVFGPSNPHRKAPLNKGARFIWHDQDKYQPDYEIYGTLPSLPKGEYFKSLKLEDIEQ